MIWETGTAVKAHDWFVIPLALGEHRLYPLLGARKLGASVRQP
jgi:hypothetical protein